MDGAPDATVADILTAGGNLPVLVPEMLGDDGNLRSNIAIFPQRSQHSPAGTTRNPFPPTKRWTYSQIGATAPLAD